MQPKHGSDPSADPPASGATEALDDEVVQLIAHEAKATLRKRARGVRASVPKSAIERRSNEIVSRLLALPVMAGARRVALFAAMTSKNEVNLHALDVALRARGAVVAYPSIDAQTRVMSFRDPGDPATMKPRGMMAPEPDPASPEIAELDLVVVPALLVDPRGYRLGYGGGFYDRTLLRYCPPARSIAVAFEFQIALDLPRTAHDVACDIVVSDAGIVKDVDGVSQL